MSLPWILIQYGPDGAAGPTNGTIAGPPPWVLIGYGTSGDAVVIPPAVIDSFARGGGAKQFKKYQQAEDKFQRRKREAEQALNETLEGRPKKALLRNTAELGGPKVIEIDDDDDDYDIMMWAAQ